MALTTTVNPGDKITSAWGNEVRNRSLQVFANAAERDSQWAAAPVGSHAFLSDVQQITVKRTTGWINIDPANALTAPGVAVIRSVGGTEVQDTMPATLTAITKALRVVYAGGPANYGIGFVNGLDFARNCQIAVPGAGAAFHFQNTDGSAYVPLNASAFTVNSSRRFKRNVKPLEGDALQTVAKLEPVSFERTNPQDPGTRLGLVAEDVATVVPEAVTNGEDGKPLGIDYGSLVPVLLRAIQQLTDRVRVLEASV